MKNESASGGAKGVSDEQLIAQFQAGELSAFEEIVGRYQGQLINFVCRLLNDRNTAEDIVQETFLRVYRNKHRYKEIARFSTWISLALGRSPEPHEAHPCRPCDPRGRGRQEAGRDSLLGGRRN